MISRRDMIKAGALGAAGAVMLHKRAAPAGAAQITASLPSRWDKTYSGGPVDRKPLPPGLPGKDYKPVHAPNGYTLPFEIVDGVKVFHLIAEEIEHEFAPGLKAHCWGYNGHVNGTVIEAVEGERVRIYVTNRLPAPTSVHWHGIYLPNGMDGVSALTQRPIRPGETFKYEWTVRQHGTFLYHSHYDVMIQEAMGLIGMMVVHPRNPTPDDRVDRDFAVMLSEWRIDPGTSRPNVNEMADFNILTMNGKAFPGIAPMVTQVGDRVRIRFGNLSAMDHHPMHMHGHYFKITATDGAPIPVSAQWPETTVLVAVGQTRDIELITDAPGDWAFHCHMSHHIMNQMGHEIPNMIGARFGDLEGRIAKLLPDYMTMGETGMGEHGKHIAMGHLPPPKNSIPMVGAQLAFGYSGVGGMFTVLKVREKADGYDDPGWYDHPEGTVAGIASRDELRRDLGSIPS